MKTITSRVSQLETRFIPRLDEQGRSTADVLRERMQRRLAEEGRELEEDPLRENLVDAGNRPITIREALRSRFRRRLAAPADETT
jgi:hypothetical protein